MIDSLDEPHPHRRFTWLIVTALTFMLVVYPLSVGPAAVTHRRVGELRKTIDIVYWPLLELCDSTGSDELLASYVEWWLRITGTDLPTR